MKIMLKKIYKIKTKIQIKRMVTKFKMKVRINLTPMQMKGKLKKIRNCLNQNKLK